MRKRLRQVWQRWRWTVSGALALAAGVLGYLGSRANNDDVTIGHALAADGSMVTGQGGDDFAPGQPVHVTMEVGDAPPNSTVKVVWYAPGETKIAEENKPVVAGQKYLAFSANDTKSWKVGDYRAEVWIGDEKVNTQQFQIVSAAGAGR